MSTDDVLNKLPLGIIIIDDSNQMSSINYRALKYLEKSNGSLLELLREIVLHTREHEVPTEKFMRYGKYVWRVQTELLETSPSQVMVIIQDETFSLRLEQTILKAEKLAVVGHLAMGSLLEIRNPLTSARGFCQLIKEKINIKREYIDIISSDLEHIQHILEDCTTASRQYVESGVQN